MAFDDRNEIVIAALFGVVTAEGDLVLQFFFRVQPSTHRGWELHGDRFARVQFGSLGEAELQRVAFFNRNNLRGINRAAFRRLVELLVKRIRSQRLPFRIKNQLRTLSIAWQYIGNDRIQDRVGTVVGGRERVVQLTARRDLTVASIRSLRNLGMGLSRVEYQIVGCVVGVTILAQTGDLCRSSVLGCQCLGFARITLTVFECNQFTTAQGVPRQNIELDGRVIADKFFKVPTFSSDSNALNLIISRRSSSPVAAFSDQRSILRHILRTGEVLDGDIVDTAVWDGIPPGEVEGVPECWILIHNLNIVGLVGSAINVQGDVYRCGVTVAGKEVDRAFGVERLGQSCIEIHRVFGDDLQRCLWFFDSRFVTALNGRYSRIRQNVAALAVNTVKLGQCCVDGLCRIRATKVIAQLGANRDPELGVAWNQLFAVLREAEFKCCDFFPAASVRKRWGQSVRTGEVQVPSSGLQSQVG